MILQISDLRCWWEATWEIWKALFCSLGWRKGWWTMVWMWHCKTYRRLKTSRLFDIMPNFSWFSFIIFFDICQNQFSSFKFIQTPIIVPFVRTWPPTHDTGIPRYSQLIGRRGSLRISKNCEYRNSVLYDILHKNLPFKMSNDTTLSKFFLFIKVLVTT